MEISETRVKLTGNTKDRLKAVCSVTIDASFVIRDIKVIEGASGLFVAMPSRKLADHCPKCRNKNHLRARFCNDCGAKLDENRADRDRSGRMKLHADIAHPINSECRAKFQAKVVEAFLAEQEKSKQPGYKPIEFEDDDEGTPAEPADRGDREVQAERPEPVEAKDGGERDDHDDLIADLKREAEARHAKRSGGRTDRDSSRGPEPRRGDERDRRRDTERPPEPARPVERPPAPPAAPAKVEEDDGFGAGLL